MKLYNYQKTGRDFLKERRYALLADEQGLGKSAQAVTAAQDLKSILVVCPASVKYTWYNEIAKWGEGSVLVVNSGKEIIIPARYTVINYDLLRVKKIFLQLISRRYDVIILDEMHYLKNFRAKRTKCIYYPRGLKDRAKRVWLLSGTPVLNRPVELYSHLKSLVPQKLGRYVSYIEYCKQFCAARETRFGLDVSGASNIPELAEILNSFMLRRLKKDVLKELPEKTYQNIVFPGNTNLLKRERGAYVKEKEGVLGELASIRREHGVEKVPRIVEHVTDILENKQKVVVFAYHREVISALMENFKVYSSVALTGGTPSRKRQEAIETFRKNNACRIFIGQIEAAGTGIDGLQDVCDTVIFAEMSWVPGQIHQAIDRCHRIGQKNAVLVQFLITAGSIDEDIANTVARKEQVISKLIKPTNKEGGMCIENELKRIADALERIADAKSVSATVTTYVAAEGKPVEKRKAGKRVPEVQVDATPEVKTGPKTGVELMTHCNTKLVGIKDPAKRASTVKAVVKMFSDKYGVKAIKELPDGKVAAAWADFDALVGGE